MKIIIKKQIEEEKDITLPCFIRFGETYTKILSEEWCIVVSNYDFSLAVEQTRHAMPFGNEPYDFITEKEFNKVYSDVMAKLSKLIPINQKP